MPRAIQHRAGDTFLRSNCLWRVGGVAVDLTDYSFECNLVTRAGGTLIAAATVTADPDQSANRGRFSIEVADTSGWPVGEQLAFFVRFISSGGHRRSSPWVHVDVLGDAP
jgi:hypothetical protein